MTRAPADDDVATVLQVRSRQEARRYALSVVAGKSVGLSVEIDESRPARVLVGQSAACDLRLDDPRASRRHAAFELTDHGVRVTDLRSTNGTFCGGVRVGEAWLEDGDTVRIGESTLRLDRRQEPTTLPPTSAVGFRKVVGKSLEMRRLVPLCERLAASDVPIILEGETGTGKEVLAESLHEASTRSGGPFIVFDCTAVPPNLLESALFGHERGSFTGAVNQRKGVFEQAHGGTLFLDEIGDLEIGMQPKLLRALQRSEVQRVGGDRWLKVDVRVIAATRRDLDREVAAGRFRDDLYYRLAVGRIELPPLRERGGDIAVLARHFWQRMGGPDPIPYALFERFEDYPWPGNVRELENAVARHIALGDLANASDEAPIAKGEPAGDFVDAVIARRLPLARAREEVVGEFERRYVSRILEEHGGSALKAAAASGIARRYFNVLRARHKAG